MSYLKIPSEIRSDEVRSKNNSLSAGMFRQIVIPTKSKASMEDLISGYERGSDPGSLSYVEKSPKFLIRTKALQTHSFLVSTRGGSIVPIIPKAFEQMDLSEGQILLSKDSNIGECAMIDGHYWKSHSVSGGIVRLRPAINSYYLFSFMKHSLFREELTSLVPRGATIAHANDLWLRCHVPMPLEDRERVMKYIAALTEVILRKERAIRSKHEMIHTQIDNELRAEVTGPAFHYKHPSSRQVRESMRLDTGLYCSGFQQIKYLIESYRNGSTTLGRMGVQSRRGPNLAVSVLGEALYSNTAKPGWYELIRPVSISEYGTLNSREWLGTPKALPLVKRGDLILGCEGFGKGRSIVLLNNPDRCTTNFHGTVLSWPDAEIWEMIFVRCFLSYLRDRGVVDWVGVGGSGGHMSPEYFEYLPFPKFPDDVRYRIASYYSNPDYVGPNAISLDDLVTVHQIRNNHLGICQLDLELQNFRKDLLKAQACVIEGRKVQIPLLNPEPTNN